MCKKFLVPCREYGFALPRNSLGPMKPWRSHQRVLGKRESTSRMLRLVDLNIYPWYG